MIPETRVMQPEFLMKKESEFFEKNLVSLNAGVR
jgi:hypothetical protein